MSANPIEKNQLNVSATLQPTSAAPASTVLNPFFVDKALERREKHNATRRDKTIIAGVCFVFGMLALGSAALIWSTGEAANYIGKWLVFSGGMLVVAAGQIQYSARQFWPRHAVIGTAILFLAGLLIYSACLDPQWQKAGLAGDRLALGIVGGTLFALLLIFQFIRAAQSSDGFNVVVLIAAFWAVAWMAFFIFAPRELAINPGDLGSTFLDIVVVAIIGTFVMAVSAIEGDHSTDTPAPPPESPRVGLGNSRFTTSTRPHVSDTEF